MLRKMMYRKILVSTSLLLVILMLYLIPSNKEIEIESQILEYVYPNNIETIYLLDNSNYLSRVEISTSKQDIISKCQYLIEALTINGKKKDIITNGFIPVIPENTKLLDVKLNENKLIINLSKEFNNVKEEYEEKLIESLIYTLTSIDGVDKLEILIEGEKLLYLPKSNKKLPKILDKNYGINKKYELTSLNDIYSYTVYYVNNYNDAPYYIPVTKYINSSEQDKVKVIIDELSTSLTCETNLMSYLDQNIKLLDYELKDNIIKLNFNNLILSDITSNNILEEVIYTISLSLCDELNVEQVIFQVDNQEIYTFSEKILD